MRDGGRAIDSHKPHRVYHLRHTAGSRYTLFGMPVLMAAVGVVAVVATLASDDASPGAVLAFLALWLGGMGGVAWFTLRIPTRIEWHDDGSVSFHARLRELRVAVAEIESLAPTSNLGFFQLRSSRGKLTFLAQFDDFHDFVARLRRANPGARIHGC